MNIKFREHEFYAKTKSILEHIQNVLDSYDIPVTSRQIFYRLVTMGIIENTIPEYHKVCRIATDGRYAGYLDWDKIIDDTRGTYKTPDWPNMREAVKDRIDNFRLDRWAKSPYYLEIFVEKRGMVNILYRITNRHDVHITACGGFDSTSNVWGSAQRLLDKRAEGKKIKILYFGDFDPSGDFMHKNVEKKLREFNLDLDLERVCLNLDQVQNYNLPVAFKVLAKKANGEVYDKLKADPRSKGFREKYGRLMQVEIDALDPHLLVELTENSIMKYLDQDAHLKTMRRETRLKNKWSNGIREIQKNL